MKWHIGVRIIEVLLYYTLTLVRCIHGVGENQDSSYRELAQESEMMIARRVASYRVEMVEVMITN